MDPECTNLSDKGAPAVACALPYRGSVAFLGKSWFIIIGILQVDPYCGVSVRIVGSRYYNQPQSPVTLVVQFAWILYPDVACSHKYNTGVFSQRFSQVEMFSLSMQAVPIY